MRFMIILSALVVAGCDTAPKPNVNVKIAGDSYCKIGEKWRWDIKDTKPTIAQARRVNAKYDRICNSRKKTKS
tara:strand:- start:223 stop:441 length:219 start_codon:yes stop_codon:yes gene_type:complete